GCGDGHFHRHYHHRYLDNSRADDYIYYCFFPQLVNMEQAYRSSNHTNLQIAFDTAQPHYGIAKLIDSEDVDNDNPDEKSQLITNLTDIQKRIDNALNSCRSLCTITQPNNPHPDVIQLIDRLEFLNRRVNDLNIHLGHLNSDNIRHTTKQQRLSGPSPSHKLSSPTTAATTRIVDSPIVVQNKNNVDLVEYLNSCLNLVKQKQNTTDRFDLGSDLPSTITDIEQCGKLSNVSGIVLCLIQMIY
ncbi:unnamed protein product, partial [Didymodactylos carnosus]